MFAEHVQRHEAALRAYLLSRYSTLPDHDDLVQETYLRVWRAQWRLRLATAKAFLPRSRSSPRASSQRQVPGQRHQR